LSAFSTTIFFSCLEMGIDESACMILSQPILRSYSFWRMVLYLAFLVDIYTKYIVWQVSPYPLFIWKVQYFYAFILFSLEIHYVAYFQIIWSSHSSSYQQTIIYFRSAWSSERVNLVL